MRRNRIFSINAISLLFVLFSGLGSLVEAKTPKPIITATGNSISFSDINRRLKKLLRDLGEPTWTNKELNRLNYSVYAYLKAFTGRQYNQTIAALRRGDRYRPIIRKNLVRHKVPLAFEALPMAESAYRFNAQSKAGARGLWQYMPASARQYGLHVGKKLDERTDPSLSSDAGARYLHYLNRKFGKISVLLSIAAYNAGEGRIARIIKKSGLKNGKPGYPRVIRYLPKETRGYVPEFLAAVMILNDPEHFGFPVSHQYPHDYIQLNQPLAIKKIAALSKLPISKVRLLNPELKQYARTPTNNFIIRLPSAAALRLNNKLSKSTLWNPIANPILLTSKTEKLQTKWPKSELHIVYKVRKGNNLGGIAKMFKVGINVLRKRNRITNNQIQIGQSIIIPIKKAIDRMYYKVRSGDNLGLIAQRLGISIYHLKFVNGVTNPRRLRPGQKLFYYAS